MMRWQLPFSTQFSIGRPATGDWVAGVCVAGLLLPEAVAYAGLAHLPVTHALTATLCGLLLYALLGTSRFAIMSPTSSAATLAAAAVLSAPEISASPEAYLQGMLGLVFVGGLMLTALGFAGQGQIAAFISRPVLRGFAFGLALTIVVKQLPDALGLKLPAAASHDVGHVLLYVLGHPAQWHLPSLLVALATGLTLWLLRPWRKVPAAMVAIVLAISAAQWLDLHAMGVEEVGHITPPDLHLHWPELTQAGWMRMAELAFGLVMILFAESWGSIRNLALSHGDTVEANRELVALGLCNLGGALLQGMPVGAGFSGSSANAAAGAASRWAGLAAFGMIVLAVLFALPALHLLPRPVLAVVVIHALLHSLNPKPLITTWRTGRDRLAMSGAVLAVLALGVLDGMLVGVGLSLLSALRRFSQPLLHELGELPNTRDFIVVDGRPQVLRLPGMTVLRPEEPMFFANADRVCITAIDALPADHSTKVMVLSLEESSDLDSTAMESLLELDQRLSGRGVTLVLSRVKDSVRELLRAQAPQGLGRDDRLYWSVADAVDASRHLL